MSGTWWTRFSIIIVVTLWAFWSLIPTIFGESAHSALTDQAESASEAADGGSADGEDGVEGEEDDAPWYDFAVPKAKINLGLDLQGGIDMTLQVGIDEAIVSAVHRDIKPLREAAERDGLKLADVRRERGEPVMLIQPAEGVGLQDVLGFMGAKYDTFEYDNTRTIDGADFYAFVLSAEQQDYIKTRSVEQALETLRSRVDETGVKEPAIVRKGADRINVQLPGMSNVKQAVAAIGTAAVLEFMLVDYDVMKEGASLDRALLDAEATLEAEVYDDDDGLSDWLVRQGHLPRTSKLMWEYEESPEGKVRQSPWVVQDEVILTGDDINDANVSMNQYNEPYTALEFKARGSKKFCDVTTENVGRPFAIILDDEVRSAPTIREAICGGRASIEMGTGDYSSALQEASVLSLVLRTGALPAPVTVGEVRVVGASLGQDAIDSGRKATVVGFGFVLVFMSVYYKRSGLVSVTALCLNVVLVMALLATAGATLTLPGIAGIALTVGMAVDANIIIYERIREEMRLGKNSRASVDTGFDLALWAVLDANITTFIAGVVLYSYGTGPIKGFAVTLMIGINTTLFTGIFVSRTLMDLMTRRASARLSI